MKKIILLLALVMSAGFLSSCGDLLEGTQPQSQTQSKPLTKTSPAYEGNETEFTNPAYQE